MTVQHRYEPILVSTRDIYIIYIAYKSYIANARATRHGETAATRDTAIA